MSAEQFQQRLNKWKTGVPVVLKSVAQRGAMVYYGNISAQMGEGYKVEAPSHRPKQSVLAISSGRLLQSFGQTPSQYPKSDRIFDVDLSGDKVDVKIGSNVPYASIQNRGGSINPTPKMARFFLTMWLKTGGGSVKGKLTGDPFWFAMWIHAKQGKPFNIPAKNFKEGADRDAAQQIPQASYEIIKAELQKLIDGE